MKRALPASALRAATLGALAICASAQVDVALAVCSYEVRADDPWVQVTPAGAFKPRDGRPMTVAAWRIDDAIAARVIAAFRAQATPPVFDYEHQTLAAEENGQPAPAAGFIQDLEWRPGVGLFAKVDWTARAKAYIEAKEYRYVSPVFRFDTATGELLRLEMAALTNNPAIDGMAPLSARAAARFAQQETSMNLRAALIAALALAATTTDDEIATAVAALKAKADGADADLAALKTKLAGAESAVATLKSTVDPTKFVSVDAFESVKTELAALKAASLDAEVTALVTDALAAGKLLPAQKEWAEQLGKADVAQLRAYIVKTPAIAALRGQQTAGRGDLGQGEGDVLTDAEQAVCRQVGVTPEAYIASRKHLRERAPATDAA
ncbi:MAG: phage protease [Xanthomonadaceae bacterium]|nr:phage protease [Xanthomonadaceae bacterium]